MPASGAALEFAQEWFVDPKMYIGMILPNIHPFRTRDVMKLAKKINAGFEGRDIFFMVHSNITIYNVIPHTRNELIWYPFHTTNYEMDCRIFDSTLYNT